MFANVHHTSCPVYQHWQAYITFTMILHNIHYSLLTCQALKFSRGRTNSVQSDGQWIYRHLPGHDLGMGIGDLSKQVALKWHVPLLRKIHTRIWHGSITKALWWATLYLITPWAQAFYTVSNNSQQAETQVDLNC